MNFQWYFWPKWLIFNSGISESGVVVHRRFLQEAADKPLVNIHIIFIFLSHLCNINHITLNAENNVI